MQERPHCMVWYCLVRVNVQHATRLHGTTGDCIRSFSLRHRGSRTPHQVNSLGDWHVLNSFKLAGTRVNEQSRP